MKKRIITVFLLLLLLVSIALPVCARDVEYFTEGDVKYCWVRGSSKEKPSQKEEGYTWIPVYREDGKRDTRKGTCDYAGTDDHVCDIFCDFERTEYKWQLVVKELMFIQCLDSEGTPMTGCEFILLKQTIITDDEGNYVLDDKGKLQYESSQPVCRTVVETDGTARIRLDESKLDQEAEFNQLVLGQILTDEQSNMYSPLTNRWYVNIVKDENDEFVVYSVTEAPAVNITDPEKLSDTNFGVLGEESVEAYYPGSQTLVTKNDYRLGNLILKIELNGFDGEVPSTVRTIVTISGPNEYKKKLRKDETLSDMRMGAYTVEYAEPAEIEGYSFENVVITVRSPVEADPVPIGDDKTVVLDRDHVNAIVTVTYNYKPAHIHNYDAVITYPTCTTGGYTTYTCKDEGCDYSYIGDVEEPLGHNYEETVMPSTCVENGYIVYTCSWCEDSYQETGEVAVGHEYTEVIKSPTCVEQGYTEFTCTKCGYAYKDDYVDILEHDYKIQEKTEPTCTEPGGIIYSCANCGGITEEKGEDASGHDYKTQVVNETCTANGYTVYKCTKCNYTYQEDGKAAPGHKYTEKVTRPTCTEKGFTTYTCNVCGYQYSGEEVEAAGHKYTSKVVEPTTQREGYTIHTCSVCKDTYTDDRKDKLPATDTPDEDETDKDESDKNESNKNESGNNGTGNNANGNNQNAGNTVNTVLANVVDDLDSPMTGTEIGLYSGNTRVAVWRNAYQNLFVLDNLGKYAKTGETVTYVLRQTKAADGYELSQDAFTIKITNYNGKTEVDVKGHASNSGDVEIANDGKQIVTFRNTRKTTKIELSCQTSVEFDENCWVDEALVDEYQKKQHTFVLTWKDAAAEEHTESIQLAHGEIGLLEAELPFESEYAITVENPEGVLVAEFSESAAGTITKDQVKENVVVTALVKYAVQTDEESALHMVVVDAETKQPLEGVIFELRNPYGLKVATIDSNEAGEVAIADKLTEPGDYLLTQVLTLDGYDLIKGAAPITVSADYEMRTETGTPVLVQTMSVEIAHQAVKLDAEGGYQIENARNGAADSTGSNGSKRGAIGIILGVAGGVAAAGGATTFLLIRRKRKKI